MSECSSRDWHRLKAQFEHCRGDAPHLQAMLLVRPLGSSVDPVSSGAFERKSGASDPDRTILYINLPSAMHGTEDLSPKLRSLAYGPASEPSSWYVHAQSDVQVAYSYYGPFELAHVFEEIAAGAGKLLQRLPSSVHRYLVFDNVNAMADWEGMPPAAKWLTAIFVLSWRYAKKGDPFHNPRWLPNPRGYPLRMPMSAGEYRHYVGCFRGRLDDCPNITRCLRLPPEFTDEVPNILKARGGWTTDGRVTRADAERRNVALGDLAKAEVIYPPTDFVSVYGYHKSGDPVDLWEVSVWVCERIAELLTTFAEEPPEDEEQRQRNVLADVNARAIEMLRKKPGMVSATSEEWAAALDCSPSHVRNLSAWKSTRVHAKKPREVELMGHDGSIEREEPTLDDLVAEQKAEERKDLRAPRSKRSE